MRERGIHVWDGFPCYVTTAYTEDDITRLIETSIECVEILSEVGILNPENVASLGTKNGHKTMTKDLNRPPVPGARLGLDPEGNPAWFVADKNNVGAYVQIDL